MLLVRVEASQLGQHKQFKTTILVKVHCVAAGKV